MYVFVSRKAKHIAVISLFALFLIISFISLNTTDSGSRSAALVLPVSRFDTEAQIYTIIAIADEETSLKNVTVFAQICRGLGIVPTVFAETDTIKKLENVIKDINGFKYEFGLICDNTDGMTRSQMLKLMALKNDEFYNVVGRHSLCCYINGTNSQYAADVMASYGQYGISHSVCAGKSEGSIRSGDIVAVELSSENSVYDLVSLVTEAASKGLKAVPMKEYILEYESLSES